MVFQVSLEYSIHARSPGARLSRMIRAVSRTKLSSAWCGMQNHASTPTSLAKSTRSSSDTPSARACVYDVGVVRCDQVTTLAENNVVIEAGLKDRPGIEPGDYRGSEWTGAVFSPDGETLFANIQSPGITFAIRGPWSSI